MKTTKIDSPLEKALEDTAIDGVALPLDPHDAELMGAVDDKMPLEDVINAAHDTEV